MQDNDWNLEEGNAPPTIDLRELFAAAWRRRGWILACALVGGVLGLGVAVTTPNTYTSTAKLLLRMGQREEITPEALYGIGPAGTSRPTIQDELHLLDDRSVYAEVVERVGAAEIARPFDPRTLDGRDTPAPARWMHALQAKLAGVDDERVASDAELTQIATKILQSNTVVGSDLSTNVIFVRHTAASPERAQATAQHLVETFIARHREHFSVVKLVEDGLGELEQARKQYEQAQSKFDEHLSECGFLAIDQQLEQVLEDIHALDRDQESSKVRLAEIEVELERLVERMNGLPATIDTIVPAVKRPNEVYSARLQQLQSWNEQLQRLDEQGLSLEEKERRRTEYVRTITELEQELEGLERDIVVQPQVVVSTPDPYHVELVARIADLDLESASLQRRLDEQASLLVEKRALIGSLGACLDDHHHTEVELERNERRYLSMAERFANLEALASIDLEGDANLRMLHAPDLPWDKDGPNRKKIVLMGLLAGAALGFGLSTLKHLTERSSGGPSAEGRVLDGPVLTVMHEPDALRGAANGTRPPGNRGAAP